MLEIKNISKVYVTSDLRQVALDKVSINFRKSEFVSILGPSGSGKTTLLNIIGGLDRYDSGDLIINGVSTKKYNDRDWDTYRNHKVGFIFQSYNLIAHQSVLSNVELALTLSGVSKKARRKRAIEALKEVGLSKHINKRPTELSGGQMQRVAIARALVNNPDIILADEPTGALDTVTSKQIMELLKKVAKNKLVIMVTHNPELANDYSTRIIKVQDGKVLDDTNPYNGKEKEKLNNTKDKKTSMSFLTALSLSLNNLLTKKGRTILTAFAGSIGIIGIALILSVSTGFQNYIDKIQEDTLTSYPLTINRETSDTMSILLGSTENNSETNKDKITEVQNFQNIFSKIGTNDMKTFKKYIENNKSELDKYTSLIRYSYEIEPLIYTKDINGDLLKANPSDLFSNIFGSSMMMNASLFAELPENTDMVSDEYKLIYGEFPKNYDEIMLILPNEYEISDLLLYSIGLKDQKEFNDMFSKIINNEKINNTNKPLEYTLETLKDIDLRLINNADTYKYNSKYNIYEDMSNDLEYMNKLYNNATKLKIVGISTFKNDNVSSFASGVAYTSSLTKYVINNASKEEIVQKQIKNKDINIFSNKSFDDSSNKSGLNFNDLISIDTKLLSSAFGVKLSEKDIENLTSGYMNEISDSITTDISKAQNDYISTLNNIFKNIFNNYISDNNNLGITNISLDNLDNIIDTYLNKDENTSLLKNLENNYVIPSDSFKLMYKETIKGIMTAYVSSTSNGSNTTIINNDIVNAIANTIVSSSDIISSSENIAHKMVEATMQKTILSKVGELTGELTKKIASSFNVDEKKIASAFKFNLSEDEVKRLFSATTNNTVANQTSNLRLLGYQDLDDPSTISFYFKDFASKEEFIKFLNNYNDGKDEEFQIKYTDITGVLISSVKVIVDAVSYVLIAFVSISLVVSSIMIGIITYISVLERTKEIGILRAIGASKKNISSIFNAETFIVGLISGLFGIGLSLLLLIPINLIIHSLVGNNDITAVLPVNGAIILIIISVILTLIGGLIPSKSASRKDPVEALRSE